MQLDRLMMSYDVNVVYGDCFISVIILIAQSAHEGNIVLTSPLDACTVIRLSRETIEIYTSIRNEKKQ